MKCCKVCPPRLSVGVRCSISSLFPVTDVREVFVFFFFFQALNFLVEGFGLLNDLFPFPSILDAGYPVFDFHLADILFDVIDISGAST